MVVRVIATSAALELIAQLRDQYGPELLFHQSGGCCDNSAANCYLPGDLTIGTYDVHLGVIGGVSFYIGAAQNKYWKHPQLIIDVIAGLGVLFRSRVLPVGPFIPARESSAMPNRQS